MVERKRLIVTVFVHCIVVHWYRVFGLTRSVEGKSSFVFAV